MKRNILRKEGALPQRNTICAYLRFWGKNELARIKTEALRIAPRKKTRGQPQAYPQIIKTEPQHSQKRFCRKIFCEEERRAFQAYCSVQPNGRKWRSAATSLCAGNFVKRNILRKEGALPQRNTICAYLRFWGKNELARIKTEALGIAPRKKTRGKPQANRGLSFRSRKFAVPLRGKFCENIEVYYCDP